MAEIIGVTERSIERNVNKLKKEGKLKRIGPDKGGYWEIVQKKE
jgi:ATP-dependent DNA helicase RecG